MKLHQTRQLGGTFYSCNTKSSLPSCRPAITTRELLGLWDFVARILSSLIKNGGALGNVHESNEGHSRLTLIKLFESGPIPMVHLVRILL